MYFHILHTPTIYKHRAHVKVCGHQEDDCVNGCGRRVKLKNLQSHLATKCRKRDGLCPNAGCGMTLANDDELKAHREDCLHEKVACLHADLLGLVN